MGRLRKRLRELAWLHRTFVIKVERGERNVTLAMVEKQAGLKCRMADLMPDLGTVRRRLSKTMADRLGLPSA